MTSMASLLFEVADTFNIEIAHRNELSAGCLTGETKVLWPVMQGLDWALTPKLVDSGYYEGERKVGALLHVTGSLFLLLLVDGGRSDAGYQRLWVLDGAKLDWLGRSSLLVFPVTWNRELLYRNIQQGVVASFHRTRKDFRWTPVDDARGEIAALIQASHAPPKTEAEKVVETIRSELSRVSDRYRTLGPRGT